MYDIRLALAKKIPHLGILRRYLKAFITTLSPVKKSYSQYGEDLHISELIEKISPDRQKDIYVDIGANHPMDLSNTYLFYRKGYRGVTIEPNTELIGLHKTFRKRDIAICIGCSEKSTVARFTISKTPVLSSFNDVADVWKTEYVPLLPLDDILLNIEFSRVFLLSIDVEGQSIEVLKSAKKTLERAILLVVEYNDKQEHNDVEYFLAQNNFSIIQYCGDCNLIAINNRYK
jgi:FkbM family methyltransferase